MIYTETQTAILHWSLVGLMALSASALVAIWVQKKREYQKLKEWRRSLRRYHAVRVKGYENPQVVWVNNVTHIILRDGHRYQKVLITDVYPVEIQKWEVI